MEGQRIADSTKKSYFFEWRGYKACISSQLPKLSIHEVNRRFELAMQSIQKAKEQEQGPSVPLPDDEVVFKKPTTPSLASNSSSQSSGSQPESTSSQQSVSSLSLESEEPTQIPETQFDMDGKYFAKRYL